MRILLPILERRLDAITMYRVVIYALLCIAFGAFVLSITGILSISPFALFASFVAVGLGALIAHYICVRVSKAPGNVESSIITALILFLIITPATRISELLIATFLGALAIVLKYIVRYRLRHVFNPVALVLFLSGIVGYTGVEWWVGSRYLLPVVLIAGLAVVIKTRRTFLVTLYILISTATVAIAFLDTTPMLETVVRHFISWPTVFFATFMLTEPLGLPSTRKLQAIYAGIVGALSAIPFSFGSLHGTPELALLAGNLFTFVIDHPARLRLTLVHKRIVGRNTTEYVFSPSSPVQHIPGQYLEWTLPHKKPDTRGIRRYFTISSAPDSLEVSFAVRHLEKQSTWKTALATLQPSSVLYATQHAGDFTLDPHAPYYVWIAGGIGVTPFISMIRDAVERGAKIPATLFYCSKSADDIAFRTEIEGSDLHGVRIVHVLETGIEKGIITEALLTSKVPEWVDATYYVSGPPGLVDAYKKLLGSMGIPGRRIVTDYFPGLA